jgi:hypothetical protein
MEREARATLGQQLAEQGTDLSGKLQREQTLGHRRTVRAVLITRGLLLTVFCLLAGRPWVATGMGTSVAVFYTVSRSWIEDPSARARYLAVALIPQLVALVDVVHGLRN